MARIGWIDRVSNVQVWSLALGADVENTLSQCMMLSILRWLSHVLHMVNIRLPYHAFSFRPSLGEEEAMWKSEDIVTTSNGKMYRKCR